MSATAGACLDEPAPAGRLKTDSLAASVAVLLALTVVQRSVGFLRGILFCRWLDAEQLGQWDMAFGFLMLAAPLAVLGLPGSFGRYVEHYCQRGQLRPFLRRTTLGTLLPSVLAVGVVAAAPAWFSRLIFGTPRHASLVLLLAVALAVMIGSNFLYSLLTALRQVKVVSLMQFATSLLFAAAGILLLLCFRAQAASVVIALLVAYALPSVVVLVWLRRVLSELPATGPALSGRTLWARLLPFAFWLWLTNWLSNTFALADRFLIVHCDHFTSTEALGLVGQYHAARLFPVLFVGVAELLGAVVTPHLGSDWEAGHRGRVSQRLALILKLLGLGLTAVGVAVMLAAPLLFRFVWEGRYAGGLEVLPWALMCSVWTGVAFVSYNYLWYAEKSRWIPLTLAIGLGLNVVLTLWWLPALGLLGAVLATAAARLVGLGLLWALAFRHGMQFDRGLLVVAALPLGLGLGPWGAAAVLLAIALGKVPGLSCFSAREKAELADMAAAAARRLRKLLRPAEEGALTAD